MSSFINAFKDIDANEVRMLIQFEIWATSKYDEVTTEELLILLADPETQEEFENRNKSKVILNTPKTGYKNSSSAKSYQKTNLGKLDQYVLDTITQNPEITRRQISLLVKSYDHTVSGCLTRLQTGGYIKVVREVFDELSKRMVRAYSVKG
jgi:hypothetical protein